MTEILIADPHAVFCDALRFYLQGVGNGLSIKTVSDKNHIEWAIGQNRPAITLIGGDFYDPRYFENHAGMKIAVLVDHSGEIPLHDPLSVAGVFLRSMSGKEIYAALHTLAEMPVVEPTPVIRLTKREREVLVFLGQGASNKEIARALDVQEVTVKLHVRGICRKLGARNRTQAALIAREYGL